MFGRAARWAGWAAAFCFACGATQRDPAGGQGGAPSSGGASTGGFPTGGHVLGTGGVTSGGSAAPGKATGGVLTTGGIGGLASGGTALGGVSSGGSATGGKATGGVFAGGASGESSAGGVFSAGAGGEAGAPSCDDYVACGCGCCGGTQPTEVSRCYYPDAGEALAEIVLADQMRAADPSCASAGCSAGVRYACCLRGSPEPTGSATYTGSYASTALDRITIAKNGSDGRCGRLVFVLPGRSSSLHTALTLPSTPGGVPWGMESAYESACSMSALPPAAMGAIGSLRLRPLAGGCVADVHITAFFARNGGVQPIPFDVDGLTLENVSPSLCQ